MPRRPRSSRKQPAPPTGGPISFVAPVSSIEGTDHLVRVVLDTHSKQWGYYETAPDDLSDDATPPDIAYPHTTVADATRAALQHLAPWLGDPDHILTIYGGVHLDKMPGNVRVVMPAVYQQHLDAAIYSLDQPRLQALTARKTIQAERQSLETASRHDIPIGELVHAFRLLRETLWPDHRKRSSGAPKINDYLDQMMPVVDRKRRDRHYKCFAIVTSDDWPAMQAEFGHQMTGMASILRIAREYYSKRKQPQLRKLTPFKQRWLALRVLVLNRKYAETRRQVLEYDEEDADVPAGEFTEDDATES